MSYLVSVCSPSALVKVGDIFRVCEFLDKDLSPVGCLKDAKWVQVENEMQKGTVMQMESKYFHSPKVPEFLADIVETKTLMYLHRYCSWDTYQTRKNGLEWQPLYGVKDTFEGETYGDYSKHNVNTLADKILENCVGIRPSNTSDYAVLSADYFIKQLIKIKILQHRNEAIKKLEAKAKNNILRFHEHD